ncbi:MAG: SseB family protein [Solirubrobacteraceae bacterium]
MPFWRRGRDRGTDADPAGTASLDPSPPAQHPEALEIEGAMRRVAEQDTPEHRRALFELLLGATLLATTADPAPAGAEQGLATVAGENGPVLPVFTRPEALLAWRPDGYKPVGVTGRVLFEIAARHKAARIDVNPASAPRGWISRTEIEALAQGRLPLGPTQELAPAGGMKVGPPAVRPPDALIQAARRALEAQPHAVAGWLFATEQDDGAAQLIVGVQLARGLDQAATEETMQAIVEETWARSTDADRLRFMVVATKELYDTLRRGGGDLIFKR